MRAHDRSGVQERPPKTPLTSPYDSTQHSPIYAQQHSASGLEIQQYNQQPQYRHHYTYTHQESRPHPVAHAPRKSQYSNQQHLLPNQGQRCTYAYSPGKHLDATPDDPRGTHPKEYVNVTPDQIRIKLERVLADKTQFIKSAKASFQQFDQDQSGTLYFPEVRLLVNRLCLNLQLPPVDSTILEQIFNKYDADENGSLDLEEFAQLYWRLLLSVRERFYPSKKFRVRRNVFVGRFPLGSAEGIQKIFKFQKKIGAGSFGEVHLVKELRSGFVRVCKTINKDQAAVPVEQIEAEINILKALDHPNIIKIYDVYEDYNSVYIIMEHCKGGELLDRVVSAQQHAKVLTEKHVMGLMQQILLALSYIHLQKIVHKDLKPENVLFQDGVRTSPVKVIDFGLAEIFKTTDEFSRNAAGTVLYMAPEVFQRRLHLKCDVWSAGCIMYLLLSGHLPFAGKSVSEIRRKVMKEEPPYALHCRSVSDSALDLLRKMLTKEPKERYSASEALRHTWFKHDLSRMELHPTITNNLKKYMKHAGLKNVLINLMAHQLDFAAGGQVKHIADVFNDLDKDQNGVLSAEELAKGLRRAGLQPWEITKIVQALDIDGSGTISYTEFLAACYTWRESELNILWTAFNKLDTDSDGVISVAEFSRLLLGDDLNNAHLLTQSRLLRRRDGRREELEEEVRCLVQQIDKDGDGKIDWDEFLDYMRGTEQGAKT